MKPYYLDPAVTSVDRLPARWRRTGCPSISLNGEWKFRLFARPEDAGDFYLAAADEASYAPIQVPGNWETQQFGEPIYTNYAYPWPLDGENGIDGLPVPWRVPADNPTGCYRRHFTLDAISEDVRYVLRFEGVETAYELYVNGQFAGYAEDSKLASEFDVSDYLTAGENLIALRVFTYATSSYLEDQDYWYLNGIFRPVTLLIEPAKRIEDVRIEATPDRWTDRGELIADVKVSRVSGFGTWKVRAVLKDASGNVVGEATAPVAARAEYSQYGAPTASTARIRIALDHVERWSPEKPVLYTAEFELLDADKALDSERIRVGFKRVEIEDGILLINGQRALIFGVNRHDFAWKTGRTVSREHMIEEIRSMKRMNINAVRTCHYPDSELWYDLCDELGLLVLCECNLETHGVMGEISHTPQAAMAYVERAMRMVMQHKNHACIYGWSLGNESGFGPNHAAMYGLIKEYDRTRICQYEAGNPGANISDIRGQMYAGEKQIMAMLTDPRDNRPVILVEYLYQIRNSGGGMRKFIEFMRRYERFQGGFIWDWQDKALLGKTASGEAYFAHGGDFGERFTEPIEPVYMTNNGVVRADLSWKPVAYEVKEAYAPLLIDHAIFDSAWAVMEGDGVFSVINHSLSETSDHYRVILAIQNEDGAEIDRTELAVPTLRPGEQTALELAETLAPYVNGKALYLEFVVIRRATGETVAQRQFKYRDEVRSAARPVSAAAPAVQETEDAVTASGEGFCVSISKATGMLREYTVGGVPKILASRLSTDRPYSGLDAEPGWGWRQAMDEARALIITCEKPEILTGRDSVAIQTAFSGPLLRGRICWTVYGDGSVACALDGQAGEGLRLPRLGVEFTVPGCLDSVSYTGYGPMENYSDRMLAPRFGRYSSSVDGLGYDYAPPSENGGREGVVALEMSGNGRTLCFSAAKPFHFDARRCTVDDLKSAMHTHEVPRCDEITLHLDAWHMPIGGDMSWSTMLDSAKAPHAGFHALRMMMR
ncbi:MAG: glycoside hydrolase family 2 TIM barrel-domain containing protein [Candidatus Faecivicinus sp.]